MVSWRLFGPCWSLGVDVWIFPKMDHNWSNLSGVTVVRLFSFSRTDRFPSLPSVGNRLHSAYMTTEEKRTQVRLCLHLFQFIVRYNNLYITKNDV